MQKLAELPMLRVGFIGSCFIAAFHLQSMLGVRNVSIGGVYSRSLERRTRIADEARSLGLGRFCSMGGGAPLTSDGQLVAGVGVSGGTVAQDVAILEGALRDVGTAALAAAS